MRALLAAARRLAWRAGFSRRCRLYRKGYEGMASSIASSSPRTPDLERALADRELVLRSLSGDPVSGAYASGEAAAIRVELSRRSVD